MKKWTVYQVVNRVNGRRYIGVHKTEDPNDSYMGSGKLIRYAVQKHGAENFRKEILLVTEFKKEAFALEASLVTKDALESGQLYNLKEGGEGGWDFCNESEESIKKRVLPWSKAGGIASNRKISNDPVLRDQRLERIANIANRRKAGEIPFAFQGKSHSEETKKKMSESKKITAVGSKNSQFGTIWVTDGVQNLKIRGPIPEGWRPGRTI